MKVPQAQPVMTEDMIQAAAAALRNERLTLGESVNKFEEGFARMCGTKHAVALSSGTAALQLALQAAGVKCGDKVLTSAMSFVATSNSFVVFGGEPVFTDVDHGDFNLDPAKLRFEKGTKAVIPVHLYGHPARMAEINEAAAEHGAVVIEDACQAHGAVYRGRRAGALGLMGCFSFYPTKNMHVGGDGGMVTTDDPVLADLVRRLRHCGRKGQYEHDLIGTTARLNSANAAVGIEQLKMLPKWNEKRRAVAAKYDSMLKGIGDLRLPPGPSKDVEPVYHQYAILTKRRNELKAHLESKGVGVGVHYDIPIHLQPVYREIYGFKEGMLPVTERLCKEVLTLPMFVDITDEQVKYVVESIGAFYG
ncbi:MAG: DegT/DnrJ/EryC1/StrS family aminotransferase [Candidatus Thermoplasmatota archaeon]